MTQLPHYTQKYRIKGNRLYETVAGKNGTFERLLCNFVSWIIAEITLDDGAETTTWIRLRGIHESGRTLPEIEIPAADLAGFNWLAQRWGMDCILEVGKTVKDCVRHAIQTTAANAEKKTVYFEEAVLDFDDPQPDRGGLGTGTAYLAADLSNIVDHKPVEDSTTKHFRPERKRRSGPTMGGM